MRLRRKDGTECEHSVGSSPLFANCTNAQRDRVEQLSSVVTVPAGRQLTHEGDIGKEFAVIIKANVEKYSRIIRQLGLKQE